MAVIVCSNTLIVPSSRLNLRNFKVPQTDIARTQQSEARRRWRGLFFHLGVAFSPSSTGLLARLVAIPDQP
jgi:hypothetical protein